MAEYIAKSFAIELMHQSSYLSDGDLLEVNGNLVKARIEAEPAADVAPVIHSEWERHMSFGICRNCGYEYNWTGTGAKNFCPNCGADMRGDRKE